MPFIGPGGSSVSLGTWATFAPATTGLVAETVNVARWIQVGKIVYVVYNAQGTSNATTKTFTLPITTASLGTFNLYPCYATDNGVVGSSPGLLELANSSTTATLTKTMAGTAWTNTGSWQVGVAFFYETP